MADVLIGLLSVPVLVAAARRGPWSTAGVYGVCLALAVLAGLWDGIFLESDHLLRVLVVAVVGALAVWIASIRARAERDRTYAVFLAQASVVLEEALQADAILRRLAELAVPRLADWCAIHVASADGTLGEVLVAHPDPASAQEIRRRWAGRLDPSAGPARVIQTGEPELIEDVRRDLAAGASREAGHLEMLRSLGARSTICVPLRARGRTL